MLKISQLTINKINGIDKLDLRFNPGLNFISGRNGVGKTTILDCISSSFNRHTGNVKVRVGAKEGYWNIVVDNEDLSQFEEFTLNRYFEFNEDKRKKRYDNAIKSREIINFSISRTNHIKYFYENQFDFIQSWVYKNYYEVSRLSNKQYNNMRIIQKCFNKLDPNIHFSRVEKVERNGNLRNKVFANIYVKTPQGEIPLDYLSAGYKSSLIILLGIIKQVEVSKTYGDINTFKGVILIDELDLHLHPEWQCKLVNLIKWLVPEAQVIATTHSPHIIQIAEPGEIISLGMDEYNNVFLRDLPESTKYGFQGWTIEEILTEVMGLSGSRSSLFNRYIDQFNRNLQVGNYSEVKEIYKELSNMIHPANPLAKILRIQAGESSLWEESKYDSTY